MDQLETSMDTESDLSEQLASAVEQKRLLAAMLEASKRQADEAAEARVDEIHKLNDKYAAMEVELSDARDLALTQMATWRDKVTKLEKSMAIQIRLLQELSNKKFTISNVGSLQSRVRSIVHDYATLFSDVDQLASDTDLQADASSSSSCNNNSSSSSINSSSRMESTSVHDVSARRSLRSDPERIRRSKRARLERSDVSQSSVALLLFL
jgi:hypothetical protein